MRCQFCGTENEEGTLFCKECGKMMEEEKQIQITYCPRCGKQNDSAALFCKECGMKLQAEALGEADVQKTGESRESAKNGESGRSKENEEGNKNNKSMRILITAAVIVLAVLGGGGMLLLGNKEGQSQQVTREEEQKQKEVKEERQASKGQDAEEDQASEEKDAEKQASKEQDTEEQDAEKTASEEEGAEEQTEKTAKEEAESGAVQEVRTQAPAITMQNINAVTASSELAEANTIHFAARTMDGDKNTAWVEGAAGQGEGQFIQFSFNNTYLVNGIRIRAGYQKNDDIYYKNSRPRRIRIEFSDGRSEAFELADGSREEQVLTFAEPTETETVSLIIESVYPGVKYEDTCISEVILF